MRLLVLAVLVQAALCGNVNIRMPYLSPAGVTYVDGSAHAGLAAGPLSYSVTPRPFAYAQPAVAYQSPLAYQSPVAYHQQPYAYQQAPLAYKTHAVAAPVAYQAYQPVTKYAAVPTVHHVPSEAHVPVTRYEAHPAVIQKAVDVAKPAIKTRKFEIRRPAIQKQFYDIEERVIVRPAGSAVVELDQPTSKTQQGQAVISPAAYAVPAVHAYKAVVPAVAAYKTVVPAVAAYKSVVPAVPAYKTVLPAYARLAPFGARFTPFTPFTVAHPQLTMAQFGQQTQQESQQPQEGSTEHPQQQEEPQTPYPFEQPQPQAPESQPQQPPQQFQQPEAPQQQQFQQPQAPQQDQPQADDDDDSVSIDNAEFSGRSAAPEASSTTPAPADPEPSAAEPQPSSAPEAAPEDAQASAPLSRSIGTSPFGVNAYDLIPQARSGPSVVPSQRNLPADISQSNQQRLIELLTARGGVTEVGLGRSGPVVSSVGDAGQVRARVVSATPAPPSAEPTGERVNTRRVVVSRPIETLQEIEVQEAVTKLERVHVQHPTFIKTARQDFVRVPTSVPVYGKALAPVGHAAVPVGPAYSTYYG